MRSIQILSLAVAALAASACASRDRSTNDVGFNERDLGGSAGRDWSESQGDARRDVFVRDRSVNDTNSTNVTVTQTRPAPVVTYSETTYTQQPYTVPNNPPRGSVQDIIRQYDQMPTEYYPDRTQIQTDGTYRR